MEELVAREQEARRRFRRRRLWTVAIIVLLLLGGFALNLVLATRPARVRALVQSVLTDLFPGDVSFAKRIEIHWGEGITLHHLALGPPGGSPSESILRVRRVVLRADFTELLFGGFRVREITLEEPDVSVARDAEGHWNLEGALPAIDRSSGEAWEALRDSFPRIVVSAGALSYIDASVPGAPIRHSLLDIAGAFSGSGERGFVVKATARTPFLDRLDLEAELGSDLSKVDLLVRATNLDISGRLARFAGPEARRLQRDLDLHGFVNIEGRFRFTMKDGLVPTGVSGDLVNGRMRPPDAPFPLERLSGRFRMDGKKIEVEQLKGWLGAGAFEGRGELRAESGWRKLTGLSFRAKAAAVPLDSRLRPWIPGRFLTAFDRLNSRGNVSVDCAIEASAFPLSVDDVSLELSFDDVEWSYRGYPYTFEGSAGKLKVAGGRFEILETISARHDAVRLEIAGSGGLRPGGPLALRIRAADLPLDDALRNALAPSALVKWDRLDPSGFATVDVSVRQGAGAPDEPGSPDVTAMVDFRDASVRYELFPYAVAEITGRMRVDLPKREVRLDDLRGFHGAQRIAASGRVELGGDEVVDLTLSAESLDLDHDMRAAFPADLRALVRELGLAGRGAVTAKVSSRVDRDTSVEVTVGVKECEAKYLHLPYALRFAAGTVRYTVDGRLELEGLTSRPGESPVVQLDGEIATMGAERIFDFRCGIASLTVDDELTGALPDDLSRLLEEIGLKGTFSGEFVGTHSYDVKNSAVSRAQYHARNVRLENAELDFGVALREIDLAGEFIGKRDLEPSSSTLSGVLRLEHARFNRLVLAESDVLFAFGKEHPAIVRARVGETLRGTSFRPTSKTIARLSEEKVGKTLQLQVRRGELYGGAVEGFMWIDTGVEGDFGGEFHASDVDISRAALDVFGVSDEGVSGTARGFVGFSGMTGKGESISGSGESHVVDAHLLRLPIFVNLVSILFARPSADPHFKNVDIRFDIREERFWASAPDGITILGDAVNLLGAGNMDFDGKLDLALVPHLLSFRIPFFETAIELVKKGLAQVLVRGTLENPSVDFGTVGGILKFPVRGSSK